MSSAPRSKPLRMVEVWDGLGGPDDIEHVVITKRVDTRWQRFLSWLDMMLPDHGILRAVRVNWGEVAPGMYRSAQPRPGQLRYRVERHDIKTVLNLRAERDCGAFVLEERLCAKLGINLVNVRVRSRDVPSKELIALLDKLFATIEYPAVMHCKSGCDRTGITAGLYLMLREGRSVEEAMAQLALRWGHIRQSKTGILDFFFESYAADNRRQPMPFRDWVRDVYDPNALRAAFAERWKGSLFGLDLAFWRE